MEKDLKNKMKRTGRKITLVPFGGLANRLKAVCSTIALALKHELELEIVWYMDEGLYCPVQRLFTLKPDLHAKSISLREATWKDGLINDYPRRNNLWIPAATMLFKYDFYLKTSTLKSWVETEPSRIEALLQRTDWEHIFLYSCWSLTNDPGMYDYVEPTVEVLQVTRGLVAAWTQKVVGVHIRRTDHVISIRQSPTELFIKTMQKRIESDPSLHFFVATDSLEERERLQTIFTGRVFASYTDPIRNTPEGIIAAYGEMLALSQASEILATKDSTFSQVAASIGGIPYHTLSIYSEGEHSKIYDVRPERTP